jgi:protein TonB
VLSHISLLLGFHYFPVVSMEKSSSEFLTVDLVPARKKLLPQKQYLSSPQAKALTSTTPKVEESSSHLGASNEQKSEDFIETSSRARLHSPKPPYPLVSRRMKEQGLVVLRLCVTPQGTVDRVDLLQSSGHQNLDRSALHTLAGWQFASVLHANINCYRMPVQFTLEG